MVRKNIWMMLLSIIAVSLIITTSVSAAVITSASIGEKEQLSIESTENVESGRIGLEEKAEIDISSSYSAEPITDTFSDTAKTDAEDDLADSEKITSDAGSTQGMEGSDVAEDIPDAPSEPSSGLIWIAIEGDYIPDGDSEIPDFDSNGSLSDLNSDTIGDIITIPLGIDVDEVIVASNSGIVDKALSVDSNLALNIVGYAEIDVLYGSENLNAGPYFSGLDLFDRLSLAAASTLMMFLVRIIQVLDVVFPIADAILIATTICSLILESAIYAIQNGLDLSTQIINIGITITIGGHIYTLTNPIRNAIINFLTPILNILDVVVKSLSDYVEQSVSNIIDYLQNLKTLFLNTDFKQLIGQLYGSSSLAVYAILFVLQHKDTTQIKTWLEQFVSPSVAQVLVSLLTSYDSLFVSIRDGIFGKFDAFMTYGRESTSLRNIHVEIDSNCQVAQGQYAAIIEIKAISAGQVFDTKTIGILYDGSGENIPDAGENIEMESSQQQTFGSTTTGSTATSSTTNV